MYIYHNLLKLVFGRRSFPFGARPIFYRGCVSFREAMYRTISHLTSKILISTPLRTYRHRGGRRIRGGPRVGLRLGLPNMAGVTGMGDGVGHRDLKALMNWVIWDGKCFSTYGCKYRLRYRYRMIWI